MRDKLPQEKARWENSFLHVDAFKKAVLRLGDGWKWGGCSDNLSFGSQVSARFLDALETGGDAEARVNLHNNEAGRIVSTTKKREKRVSWGGDKKEISLEKRRRSGRRRRLGSQTRLQRAL